MKEEHAFMTELAATSGMETATRSTQRPSSRYPLLGRFAPPRTYNDGHRLLLERAAQDYLRACYVSETAVRVSEFANDYLHVTTGYLSRIAPAVVGQSMGDYLFAKQLAHAEQLLRSTPLTIERVALASGFGTPRTFYRRFREARGITPDTYRAEQKAPQSYARVIGERT